MVDYSLENDFQDITLRDLIVIAWKKRGLVITGGIFSLVIATLISLILPNKFVSEVTLLPAAAEGGVGTGLSAQVSGLASIAGIGLGGKDDSKINLALTLLKSRKFLGDFTRKHSIEVPLIAAKGWDEHANSWIIDDSVYDVVNERWAIPEISSQYPSDWQIHKRLSKVIDVYINDDSGVVVISIESYSPYAAQQWVSWLVKDINETIRRIDIEKAEKNIEVLEAQVAKTSIKEMEEVFYNLISEQYKIKMLANTTVEYVFTVVDPPIIPEKKSSPSRALISLVGLVLGVMLVLLYLTIKYLFVAKVK